MTPALELSGIHKRFGSVQALRGADFTVLPGEVHALLGENGAGKTTLMRIAAGLLQPDAGVLRIGGRSHPGLSPRAARRLGVGMVHQHFTSVPAFTVAENVALAAGWTVAPGSLRRQVAALGDRIGLPLPPDARAAGLSVGQRQRLEILKALAADATILLLDEPTAVLAPGEAHDLLGMIRRFTSSGAAAVLITHKLDEALAAADRVTVLRRGNVVLSGTTSEQTAAGLAAAMIGDAVLDGTEFRSSAEPVRFARPVLRLDHLDVGREGGLGLAVRGVRLSVAGGELVGVAAVEGNGQRELLRAVAARMPVIRGAREVDEPIAFIPEDRTTEGLIPEMTLTENLVLGGSPGAPWLEGGTIDWPMASARTAALLEEYAVTAPGPSVPAGSLSGGNQQRVVVARELSKSPAVVVAENPTRGLDLRASAAIHARLRRVAAGGAAVLFHSSDLDEVLALATRVVVMRRGALLDPPPGAGRETIGELMLAGT